MVEEDVSDNKIVEKEKDDLKKLIKISDNKIVDKKTTLNLTPFKKRNNYILCFYYIKPVSKKEDLKDIKYAITQILERMFVYEELDIFFIQGDRQKLKLRVFCPSIILDAISFMNVRCGILKALGKDKYSVLIPIDMHEIEGKPHIFITKNKDISTNKLESYENFKCFFHPKLKTEYLEKKISEWSSYDKTRKKTPFTENFNNFLNTDEFRYTNILDNRNTLKSINLLTIDTDTKIDFKGNYDKCIKWFVHFILIQIFLPFKK